MNASQTAQASQPSTSLSIRDRERLRDGDAQTLQAFFDSHFSSVYKRIYRQVRNQLDAEDLTQDVFLRIQNSLPRLDPTKAIEPWISAILRNRIIDHWRSRGNLRESFSYDAEEEQSFFPVSRAGLPSEAQEQMESESIVRSAIDSLPKRLRSVLTMRFYDGYSFGDIAKRLGLNTATARKRYSRAIDALRSSASLADLHLPGMIAPSNN